MASNVAATQRATSLELRALIDICQLEGKLDLQSQSRQRLKHLIEGFDADSSLAEVRQAQDALKTSIAE